MVPWPCLGLGVQSSAVHAVRLLPSAFATLPICWHCSDEMEYKLLCLHRFGERNGLHETSFYISQLKLST